MIDVFRRFGQKLRNFYCIPYNVVLIYSDHGNFLIHRQKKKKGLARIFHCVDQNL